MRITVRQAGGVVGYVPGLAAVPALSVETADLAPKQRVQIEHLVEEAGLAAPPPAARKSQNPGAERVISVEIGGKEHTSRFQEGNFPEPVLKLLDALEACPRGKG